MPARGVRERDRRLPLHRVREGAPEVVDGQHVGARDATRERDRIGHGRSARPGPAASAAVDLAPRVAARPRAGAAATRMAPRASTTQADHARAHVLRADRDRERVARLGVVAGAQRERVAARPRSRPTWIDATPARASQSGRQARSARRALLHERALEVARIDARARVVTGTRSVLASRGDAQAPERRRRDVVDPEAQPECPAAAPRRVDRDGVVARRRPVEAGRRAPGRRSATGRRRSAGRTRRRRGSRRAPRIRNGRRPPPSSGSTVTPTLIARRARWKR